MWRMPGELRNEPLTIVGGVVDRKCSKDTGGIYSDGDEGSTEGREEHDMREAVDEADPTGGLREEVCG